MRWGTPDTGTTCDREDNNSEFDHPLALSNSGVPGTAGKVVLDVEIFCVGHQIGYSPLECNATLVIRG